MNIFGGRYQLTRRFQNGDYYQGEVIDAPDGRQLFDGDGVFTSGDDGQVYTGQFSQGERHGRGRLVAEDEFTFDGEWLQGLKEGHGSVVYESGERYNGEWSQDQKQGRGIWVSDGETYTGDFIADLFSGEGRLIGVDGNVYEGGFASGLCEGFGTLTSGDGAVLYSGEWKEGAMHGQGELCKPDELTYIGEFAGGLRHGMGKCTTSDGTEYDGQWSSDQFSGTGVVNMHNGTVETGTFVDGMLNGRGRRELSGKFWYEGSFQAGKYHGQGEHVSEDGGKYLGEWVEGLYSGVGSCSWANEDKYEGEWLQGKQHGQGQMVYADGTKYTGGWHEGEYHDTGKLEMSTGDQYSGGWKAGQKSGHGSFLFFSSGEYCGEWLEDRMHGSGLHLNMVTNQVFQRQFLNGEMTANQKVDISVWRHRHVSSSNLPSAQQAEIPASKASKGSDTVATKSAVSQAFDPASELDASRNCSSEVPSTESVVVEDSSTRSRALSAPAVMDIAACELDDAETTDMRLAVDALEMAEAKSAELEAVKLQLRQAMEKISSQTAIIASLEEEVASVKAENLELRRIVQFDNTQHSENPHIQTPKPGTPLVRRLGHPVDSMKKNRTPRVHAYPQLEQMLTPSSEVKNGRNAKVAMCEAAQASVVPGTPDPATPNAHKACSLAQICKKIAALDKKLEELKDRDPNDMESYAAKKKLTRERSECVKAKRNLTSMSMKPHIINA